MYCFLVLAGIVGVVFIPVEAVSYTGIVQTSSGPVRGEEVSFAGTKYKSFKGIPYAAAPTGDFRFKDPQPPASWTEVRNATSFDKMCFQSIKVPSSLTENEDCLTLSVYTPSLSDNALKPVLFVIHGGGFYSGDGSDAIYGPEYLMEHDIVVVIITYRLGPMGFLATNTPHSPGNWGLKDQVAALRWVQENIRHFGGNPNNVTIYGESAGGASVHLHLFSPLSKGLFHKAIPVSGSAMNVWSINNADQQERYSRKLTQLLGASEAVVEDPAKRVEFLRQADPRAIADHTFDVYDEKDDANPMYFLLTFTPVIEPAGTRGAFLTEHPMKMLTEGRYTRVPMMMGVTSLEGGLAYMNHVKEITPERMREVEQNVCQILPETLKDKVIAEKGCPEITQLIRDAYFDGKHFDSSLLNYINLFGDIYMAKDTIYSQRLHARYSNESFPLYNYYFTFDGRWNIWKKVFNVPLPGATHGDDLIYTFKPSGLGLPDLPPSSKEVLTKNRLSSFVANFVKYGNPTPAISDLMPLQWMRAKENKPTTMNIGDDLKLEQEILKNRLSMWEKVYKIYGWRGTMDH